MPKARWTTTCCRKGAATSAIILQRQGYFNADVEVTSRQEKDRDGRDERVISYEVSRGDRFRLAGIAFNGNKYFSNELLARRLQLQTASFQSSGRFSQQLLRDDIDSIRALYLSNGFRDVQVTSDRGRQLPRQKKSSVCDVSPRGRPAVPRRRSENRRQPRHQHRDSA